jgi:glutathione peroxidase
MRTLVACGTVALVVIALQAGRQSAQDSKAGPSPVHGLSMKRIDGTTQQLSDFKGKVALVVNVASECGLTQQYEGLQRLHARYGDRGFTVLGFPSNDFGTQEPGSDQEIFAFCRDTYQVTFPLFSKIKILGPNPAPLYRWLQSESPSKAAVKWNFHKFLIDGKGDVIASFGSKTPPDDPKLVAAIEAALAAGAPSSRPATRPWRRVELVIVAHDGLKLSDGSTFSNVAETGKRRAARAEGRSYVPPPGIEWAVRRGDLEEPPDPESGEFLFRDGGSFSEADFEKAEPDTDRIGQRTVRFAIKPDRQDAFEAFTTRWLNQPMAIVVNGAVMSAPVIQSPLREGVVISNPAGFTEEQQRQLLEWIAPRR